MLYQVEFEENIMYQIVIEADNEAEAVLIADYVNHDGRVEFDKYTDGKEFISVMRVHGYGKGNAVVLKAVNKSPCV